MSARAVQTARSVGAARLTGPRDDQLAELVRSHLRDVADFPQPGVLFKDISPLLANGPAFAAAIGAVAAFAAGLGGVDVVAGVEARGFLLAGALARELGCGLVMVRKVGKLPPPTVRRSYHLEYGSAEMEVPVDVVDGRRVLLVDDVLATGGTLRAGTDLLTEAGATVVGSAVLLELGLFGGRAVLDETVPLRALLTG